MFPCGCGFTYSRTSLSQNSQNRIPRHLWCRNSMAGLEMNVKAPAEPGNKGIQIRMIPHDQLSLLPDNLVLMNRILMLNLEILFL